FAGGGMARAGLGAAWSCLFANDIDPKKAATYRANWGTDDLVLRDVSKLTVAELPGHADLVWASFPCQDLSLAGAGAGLKGERSGVFWPFWKLVKRLAADDRAPPIVALENVCGALTSHGGQDFAAICEALAEAKYNFGAIVADAVNFVPQSRPRLFIIAVHESVILPSNLLTSAADGVWHTAAISAAFQKLSSAARQRWLWLRLPSPPTRKTTFADLIEEEPTGVQWHTAAETRRLLQMMNPTHLAKVRHAKAAGRRIVGTIYKRTRADADGAKVQRAEVRFDEIAGCLRTPGGGSSRQTIITVEGDRVRTRLLSPREAARLMGLPDRYRLSENYTEAYHLAGDGVVVPVVRFLAKHLLEPALGGCGRKQKRAA
ncbi:MAG: DNA cytosine methyltransferase, partial [Gemmatimonadaceae bacterium]